MESFLKNFEIENAPESIAGHYQTANQLFAEKGADIFCFERYGLFTYLQQPIARLRDILAEDSSNIVYAYMLYAAICAKDDRAMYSLSCPKYSLKNEAFDILPLFSLLYCVPQQLRDMRAANVPEDIIQATMGMYENQVADYRALFHRLGICIYVGWMVQFIRLQIFRVGRLNFELCTYNQPFDVFEHNGNIAVLANNVTFHRSGQVLGSIGCTDTQGSFTACITETDQYFEGCLIENGIAQNIPRQLNKAHFRRVLTAGDRVISIHIPSGGKLSTEVCRADIHRARQVLQQCFGNVNAVICQTWLLDPQLKAIIGKESNLTRFADMFELFPMKSDGTGIFEYVFLCPENTPLQQLPQTNAFSAAIKAHVLSGGHIWGAQGVLPQ